MKRKNSQRGIALIIVLGMVFLFSMFTAMMVISGRVAMIGERVHTRRTQAKYDAESITALALWYTVTYHFNNPMKGTEDEDTAEPRFLTGAPLPPVDLEHSRVRVELFELTGITVDRIRQNRGRVLGKLEEDEEERRIVLEDFYATLADYVDPDDALQPTGESLEVDEYEDIGLENWPRNGQMQFREEMYWIKNVRALYDPTQNYSLLPRNNFRVIAPRSPSGKQPNGPNRNLNKEDFWSADLHHLRARLPHLGSNELERVSECWGMGRRPVEDLRECLGEDLYLELTPEFDFHERPPTVFTLVVTASHKDGTVSRQLVTTMNLLGILPAPASRVASPGDKTLQYWQWQID